MPDNSAESSFVVRVLRRLGVGALDALLPPRCLSCGAAVDRQGGICAECWDGINFIAAPMCKTCGLPFDYDPGDGADETECGACLRSPPVFDRARAVFRYDELSRHLVLAFKHGDRTEGAPSFGAWMARAGAELLVDADLIVPVPLHWRRLFTRRFNQSALLAQALGRIANRPALADALVRKRATRSQGGLSPAGRRRNVAGAFAVRALHADTVRDRRVILVDDVMTTGATLAACARTLKRAGAARVDVLVLARVIRGAAE